MKNSRREILKKLLMAGGAVLVNPHKALNLASVSKLNRVPKTPILSQANFKTRAPGNRFLSTGEVSKFAVKEFLNALVDQKNNLKKGAG